MGAKIMTQEELAKAVIELKQADVNLLVMITQIQSFIATLELMSGVYITLSMAIIGLLLFIYKTGQQRQDKLNEQLVGAVSGINKILDRNNITENIRK
jgi:hypothetical protein